MTQRSHKIALVAGALLLGVAVIWSLGRRHESSDSMRPTEHSSESPVPGTRHATPSFDIEGVERIPDEAPRRLLQVQVQVATGEGLEGVAIGLYVGGAVQPRGLTDAEGLITMQISATAKRVFVTAMKAGYGTARVPVPETRSTPLIIVLDRAARLAGRVELEDGSSAGADVWVLAYPRYGTQPKLGVVAECIHAYPRQDEDLLLTKTDQEGKFVLHGPKQQMWLSAGYRGRFSRRPKPTVPDADGIVLTIVPGYGAVLALEDQYGEPVRLSDAFGPSGGHTTSWSGANGVSPVAGLPPAAVLAGLDPSLASQAPELMVRLFVADHHQREIGPNFVAFDFPGYKGPPAQYFAEPLQFDLPLVHVVLQRFADQWGTVNVDLKNRLLTLPEDAADGFLDLTSTETNRHDSYPAMGLSVQPVLITNVPYGTYTARFRSRGGSFTYPNRDEPPITVVVGDDAGHFELDLSQSCSLRVAVKRKDGTDYSGRLRLSLCKGEPTINERGNLEFRGSFERSFATGPYVVSGLDAGQYSLRILTPHVVYQFGADTEFISFVALPTSPKHIECVIKDE